MEYYTYGQSNSQLTGLFYCTYNIWAVHRNYWFCHLIPWKVKRYYPILEMRSLSSDIKVNGEKCSLIWTSDFFCVGLIWSNPGTRNSSLSCWELRALSAAGKKKSNSGWFPCDNPQNSWHFKHWLHSSILQDAGHSCTPVGCWLPSIYPKVKEHLTKIKSK